MLLSRAGKTKATTAKKSSFRDMQERGVKEYDIQLSTSLKFKAGRAFKAILGVCSFDF